MNQLKPK